MLSPKYKIQQFALKQVLGYLKKDPEKNLPKIIEWIRKFDTEKIYVDQYDMIEGYLKDPENNWTKLMCNIINNVMAGVWNAKKKGKGLEIKMNLWDSRCDKKKLAELAEAYAGFRQQELIKIDV